MIGKRKLKAALAAAAAAAFLAAPAAQASPSAGEAVALVGGTEIYSGPEASDPAIAQLSEPTEAEVTGETVNGRMPVRVGIFEGYAEETAIAGSVDPGTVATYDAGVAAGLREEIVNYAVQFVGGPYVWGGTSLTEGADCSGFVQSVFGAFGIGLPRTSQEQGTCGNVLPIAEAQTGDLIMYSHGEPAYHVAIYLGDGMTVQAANSVKGIVIEPVYNGAAWAVDVIGG